MVPRGALNLHGHLHGGREPTRRHLNLAVEQTDYRPVRMNGHRREGPAPAAGRSRGDMPQQVEVEGEVRRGGQP